MENVVKVRCKVCGKIEKVKVASAKRITAKNRGFIPCSGCGSHATEWKIGKVSK